MEEDGAAVHAVDPWEYGVGVIAVVRWPIHAMQERKVTDDKLLKTSRAANAAFCKVQLHPHTQPLICLTQSV